MDQLKTDILNCLKDLKGSGKFMSKGSAAFQFPGLEVEGLGEISYPVTAQQANALIKLAHKAPFGKGSKTMLDNSVRSAREIDADRLTFNGGSWSTLIKNVLGKIQSDLGLEDYLISAHLYKMLIYEKGDFFLPHKDSEKEKGMFGTLIIELPSKYTGGGLVVSFGGVKELADFAQASGDYKINFTAFYADCDHEVKPMTSGHRICLAYNLIQQKPGKNIQLTALDTYSEKLAKIFAGQQQIGNNVPHIILLGHQYTPENFSSDALKLNDRSKAEAILQAAQKAGFYAKLCLVTSYLSGMPEDSARFYYSEYGADADAEMVEIYDESHYIEHWLENKFPALSHVAFEENDLIASFALNDDEPIIKESTGYMGNYGPDLMHWYHYGAVIVWSPEANAQLLPEQDTATQLKWINYFTNNLEYTTDDEISAAEVILNAGFDEPKSDKNANFNVIAQWVMKRKDKTFFLRLSPQLCQFYFIKIDASHWLKLSNFFGPETVERILSIVTQNINLPIIEQLLAVLRMLSATPKFNNIVIGQIKKLDQYFAAISRDTSKKIYPASATSLRDLFWIERNIPQHKEWVIRMAKTLTGHPDRNYINGVLVPQLLTLKEETDLARNLLSICRQFLQERVNNQPQPPADWHRPLPTDLGSQPQWKILKSFVESPQEMVFDYRKKQAERDEMERAIRHSGMDLKTETIRKGSPYILRITKTQAAYQNAMKIWTEDRDLLNQVILKKDG